MKKIKITFFLSLIFIVPKLLFSQDLHFADKPLNCKGHRTTVNKVAFTPDGKKLISCGGANQIIIFDSKTGKQIKSTQKENSPVKCISINYNGTLIASGGYNNKNIKILSLNNLSLKKNISDYESVDDLCFSPKNNTLAVVGYKNGTNKQAITLYNADTGKKIKQLFIQANSKDMLPTCLAFSPDGKYLASGVANTKRGIYIYDINTGSQIKYIAHNADISVLKFSPNGLNIAGGGTDNNVNIWNVKSGKLLRTLKGLNDYILTLDYSSNGKYIAAAGMDHTCTFKIWKTSTGALVQSLDQEGPDINSLCFSPDNKSLAVGFRTYGDMLDVVTTGIYKIGGNNNSSSKWYNVASANAKIRISFPDTPKESTKKDQYYEYHDYSLSKSGYVFIVRTTKYLYSVDAAKRKSTINKKVNKYKSDKTNISQSTFTLNGQTGIDLIGYKNNMRYHYRLIFIGDTYYYILFKSRKTNKVPEETKFLNSFKTY